MVGEQIGDSYMKTKSMFGDRLKNARTRKGLDQSQLADQLNIKQQMVSRCETNITKAPNDSEVIKKMAELLEVSEKWLETGEEEDVPLTPKAKKLGQIFDALNGEQQLDLYAAAAEYLLASKIVIPN